MRLNPLKLLRQCVYAFPLRSRFCCICEHHFSGFMPYRGMKAVPPLMDALDVIGSDIKQFTCPRCGCHDRERHLFLYFKKSGLLEGLKGSAILHFAPESKFSKIIEQAGPRQYIQCDLYPASPRIQKIDMLNIPYDEQSFDLVMANHVLEHVDDDVKAISELHRVCKIGGHAILQTPYSARLAATICDPGVGTERSRELLYGQEDHVRLYGKDIFKKISAAGFTSAVVSHQEMLADVDPRYAGVNVKEPFFLFKRTQ